MSRQKSRACLAAGPVWPYNQQFIHLTQPISTIMANTTSTPKHTDPATKNKEDKNEVEVKDKTSGKTKKTQKK